MNLLISIFIFIVIVIFYLNVIKQLKVGEDLVIYEMDYVDNTQLQEICDLNQPVSFAFVDYVPYIKESLFDGYESYDVQVKDTHDYLVDSTEINPIPLSLKHAKKLMQSKSGSHYISENNEEFIQETHLNKDFSAFDAFIKPSFTVQTQYDYLFGGKEANTVLKYHTHYRKFLYVISGKVRVKMTSWKYSSKLHVYKDYENYEFRSPVNLFTPDEKHKADNEKTKTIDFEIYPGYALYIPPFWWHSIQYMEESTHVCTMTYNTIMNKIVNLPDTVLYYIQQQNIKTPKLIRKIEIDEPEPDDPEKLSEEVSNKSENERFKDVNPEVIA
jgi:mannose-6-phosphate isomerase-like protein (cupin superfamily)